MAKLYEHCSLCKGTTIHQGGEHCFGCKGVGFVEIGLTSGQVQRAVDCERRRLGDPSAPAPDLLVDAAPDLLAAIKGLLKAMEQGELLASHFHRARIAIVKAEVGEA